MILLFYFCLAVGGDRRSVFTRLTTLNYPNSPHWYPPSRAQIPLLLKPTKKPQFSINTNQHYVKYQLQGLRINLTGSLIKINTLWNFTVK